MKQTPPRRYVVLAFLPVLLAIATLAILYSYHRGEESRRDTRENPQAVFDALGLLPGMRVGEWSPVDTYFLKRLAQRVGPDGEVSAIRPRPSLAETIRQTLPEILIAFEPPAGLHALLFLCVRSEDQDLERLKPIIELSYDRLQPGGRFGWIGVGSEQVRGFLKAEEVISQATAVGFVSLRREEFAHPQIFIVLQK